MIGDIFSNPVFREADLVKFADSHSLTAVLITEKVVCLHGTDGFALTAHALGAALDLAAQGKRIVYVACEGGGLVVATVSRLGKARQVSDVKGLFVLPIAVDLLKQANVEALARVIAQKVGRPSLIVFDCLAFCFGADELNPQAMEQFVGNLHALAEQTHAHVLLLHRTGPASVRGIRNTAAPPPGILLIEQAA